MSLFSFRLGEQEGKRAPTPFLRKYDGDLWLNRRPCVNKMKLACRVLGSLKRRFSDFSLPAFCHRGLEILGS